MVQVVVEGVNVMLVTQEMELTAQVSFTVDTLLINCQSQAVHGKNSFEVLDNLSSRHLFSNVSNTKDRV